MVRAPPGSHIYFAYGSNVGTKTINWVRGVKPRRLLSRHPPRLQARLQRPRPAVRRARSASVKPVLPGASPDDDTTDQLARYEREVEGVAHVVWTEEEGVILRTESARAKR